MSWYTGPLLAFDLETTGLDPDTARIVTAAIVEIDPRTGEHYTRTWLLDPGVDIPEQATAVHGITTAQARADGASPDTAITEIEQALHSAWAHHTPVVIYNAPFDLTVLDRELRRYGGTGLVGRIGPVIDPLVLDKAVDRYRKGSRRLNTTCEHYAIPLQAAHTAEVDALAAARLAWVLANRFHELDTSIAELQQRQADWFATAADSFEQFLRRKRAADGDTTEITPVNRHWPLIPHTTDQERSA